MKMKNNLTNQQRFINPYISYQITYHHVSQKHTVSPLRILAEGACSLSHRQKVFG